MRRALINILENACHAMQTPEGDHSVKHGAELRVTSRAKNGRLEIIVTDNGDGIPVDVLPNIFEPLFSTKGFGVGLGLPTVRQIMKQHGGDIEVHTEIGKGTNMVLWIPEDRPATVVEVV
jgi:signal transduction histidine kinase